MGYYISHGVELPPEYAGPEYPFDRMEPGDSFVFPYEKRSSVQTLCSLQKRKFDRTYRVQRINQHECRCWRVT